MAQNSKIEWCDHTTNLWWGCTKVHLGCDNCYAETLSSRWGKEIWGNDQPRLEVKSVWSDLEKYQNIAQKAGQIHLVFVGSMMDIFEKPMPLMNSKGEQLPYNTGIIRDRFFNEIVPKSPNLLFLLLTKRPSNINKYIPSPWKENPPTNVMFGTSPSDQKTVETLIQQLIKVNGRRFLSIEPMLGPIRIQHAYSYKGFGKQCTSCSGTGHYSDNQNTDCPDCDTTGKNPHQIDWVIVGGESGPKKRIFMPEWARNIRKECKTFNVPFFMKQWDKVKAIPDDLKIREFPIIELEYKMRCITESNR